jgi:hypothetical protein
MVVEGVGARKAKVFLCREDVRMKGAGEANCLHTHYDWGATVTLVTHAAAAKAGLERKRQVSAAIAGLGGHCTMVDSYYMVPVVDGDDVVRVMKALGVDHIATLVGLPECVAFRAYNCNSQSSQSEQYSLLDPEPCGNMEKVHAIERELYGEIVQIKKEWLVQVTRCMATQTVKSVYCGW